MGLTTAAGLLLGAGLDAVFGDPRRGHPVAGFGSAAARLERVVWAPSRGRGAAYVAVLVGSAAAGGLGLARAGRPRPALRLALTAAATWVVLGGTSLRREGDALGKRLAAGEIGAARAQLSALCGRDGNALDATGLARAGVESVAENTSDAAVAPLLWGALLGIPGLLAYRASNTLDAMVGHRSERYERFGWAAARLDDVLNLAPARLTGLLAVSAAPLVGGGRRGASEVFADDRCAHPSPNSGQCEAAFAGALGVRLGGRNVYGSRVEERPLLGARGRSARADDLSDAVRLSRAVETMALVLCAALACLAGRE